MARIDCEGTNKVQKSGRQMLYMVQVKQRETTSVWRWFKFVHRRHAAL